MKTLVCRGTILRLQRVFGLEFSDDPLFQYMAPLNLISRPQYSLKVIEINDVPAGG
jgi:hypothetical protein